MVVVVVIGILAAVVIVAYNGVSKKAIIGSLTSDLDSASKQLKIDQTLSSGYPVTLAAANNGQGIQSSSGTTYQYSVNNATSPQTFCITATNGANSYYINQDSTPQAGACSGHISGIPNTFTSMTWQEKTTSGARAWRSVATSGDGSKIIAGSSNTQTLQVSYDSGATWTPKTIASFASDFLALTISEDGSKQYTAPFYDYIYQSVDNGASWKTLTNSGTHPWRSIASSSDGTKLVAVASYPSGYIYTSTDSGTSWTQRTSPGAQAWYGVDMSADGTKMVAIINGNPDGTGNPNGVYTSSDAGATWTVHSSGNSFLRYVACSADCNTIITATGYANINKSTDFGASWSALSASGTTKSWYGITMSSDGTKLAAIDYGGYIYTSTNGGTSWTQQVGAGVRNWISISTSSDGSILWATTDGGYVYSGTWQ